MSVPYNTFVRDLCNDNLETLMDKYNYYIDGTLDKLKGDLFEKYSKQFFEQTNLATRYYRHPLETPIEICNELGINPTLDEGVDAIMIFNGKYCIVQVKFRSGGRLHKREYNTTIREATKKKGKIHCIVLFTNAIVNEDNENVLVFDPSQYDINYTIDYISTQKIVIEPREYQTKLLKSISKKLDSYYSEGYLYLGSPRGKVLMFCSTGKTFVMYTMTKGYGNKFVIFVPSLYLLSQTYEKFRQYGYVLD